MLQITQYVSSNSCLEFRSKLSGMLQITQQLQNKSFTYFVHRYPTCKRVEYCCVKCNHCEGVQVKAALLPFWVHFQPEF